MAKLSHTRPIIGKFDLEWEAGDREETEIAEALFHVAMVIKLNISAQARTH